ncbi:MAG TPA: CPBP family intramembrane glutamic endopeptidase [candidate division Zixibacteria bacterium]|nr:CPBP family intramembrane glutamic endopeptidase [candidate division Zixibacteria bacterium]
MLDDISGFIRRHPISIYFVLVFIITWGGILFLVGPEGVPGEGMQLQRLFPLMFLAMIAGPSLAGILLTGITDGKEGLRGLFSRMSRWRVNIRWYGVALLITPLLLIAILAALTLISPVFVPGIITTSDRTALLVLSVVLGLAAGFFEEVGWTGFAVPKMELRYGAFVASLILGLIWAMWHFLADFWGGYAAFGMLYVPHFLLWVVAFPAYRILMVWVYNNTGSLLVAQLMHASYSGSQYLLGPSASAADNVLWNAVFAVSLWIVVAVVFFEGGAKMSVRNNIEMD